MASRPEEVRIAEEYRRRQGDSRVAGRYDLERAGPRAVYDSMIRGFEVMLREEGIEPGVIGAFLDLGCGKGDWVQPWLGHGLKNSAYHGMDLLPDRVSAASERHPGLRFTASSAERLPVESSSVDCVFQSMMLSSVVDEEVRSSIIREMWRILKPGGCLISYDMRRVRPTPHLRAVRREDFERVLDLDGDIAKRYPSTVLPPVARLMAAISPKLVATLERLPFLKFHEFLVLRKL